MDEKTLNDIKNQHINNYRKALLENVQNNTRVLVEEDIMSLLKKPPLDSMDLLLNKFLSLAKKYDIVLNMDELENILDDYRNDVARCCKKIEDMRYKGLSSIVKKFSFDNNNETFVLYKKDFISVNKEIKKVFKLQLNHSFESHLYKKINKVFDAEVSDDIKKMLLDDISKYIKVYNRQLLDSFDIKILVKDTTLINGIKEQSDHYLFTLNNSRLLNDL